MARFKPATVEIRDFKAVGVAIKASVVSSEQYMSVIRKHAEKKRQELELEASSHFKATLLAIDDLLLEGHSGARAPVSKLQVDSPTGVDLTVPVKWGPLSKRWLQNKKFRSKPGYTPNPARRRGSTGFSKGRSFGANSFWLDERKLSHAFSRMIAGRGKADVTVTVSDKSRNKKIGGVELKFNVRLNKLPAAYLDRAIRRAMIQGAGELGDATGLGVHFLDSELTTSSNPTGLARGGWAEALRPTMAPISRRLGRAMKAQILRSLARS